MMFGYQRSIFSGLAMPAIGVAVATVAVTMLVILDNAKTAGSLEQAAARNAEMAQAERLGREEEAEIFQQTLESQNLVAKAASDARAAAVERKASREARREGIAQGRREALSELPKQPLIDGLPICPVDCVLEAPS